MADLGKGEIARPDKNSDEKRPEKIQSWDNFTIK